ncbi:MAG TPA: glycosyltransferase [Polyangiaceae bacterium]|jgi:ceramide glucosyltransferase|nr:glycosyltransferase [Polyangiaceae bacterium]
MQVLFAQALVGACSVWNVAGLLALLRATRRRKPEPAPVPHEPVSVLKPLNGADANLYDNLKSFFEQDHAELELVFGVTDERDPALVTVARLRAQFPNVRCRVVVHSGGVALNPKVRNLLGMLPNASHDLILISDSNVRAPSHYVSELVRIHATTRAGIVTNLFAGSAENTLGGALENVQLNGFCAAGSALPTLVGDAALIGKSTLFSRSLLEGLGGLSRLACVLAEDFILGKMFENAGHPVVIAPTVLESPNAGLTLRAAFARHLRWAMLRWRLRPTAALLEPLTSPLLVLPFALHVFGAASLLWLAALLMLRDVGGWVTLRGFRNAWVPLALSPIRELTAPVAWALGAFKRHVTWRGQRLRLSAGTLLYVEAVPNR